MSSRKPIAAMFYSRFPVSRPLAGVAVPDFLFTVIASCSTTYLFILLDFNPVLPRKTYPPGGVVFLFSSPRTLTGNSLAAFLLGHSKACEANFQCFSVIPKFMRVNSSWLLRTMIAAMVIAAAPLRAQQAPDAFRWIDFHSAKDQDVVTWVTRSLTVENWTSIREIGVEYDAALVITTTRSNPQSLPSSDTFTVWSLSLTNHGYIPLIKGVNLRLLDWMLFADGRPRELAALYDD